MIFFLLLGFSSQLKNRKTQTYIDYFICVHGNFSCNYLFAFLSVGQLLVHVYDLAYMMSTIRLMSYGKFIL